MTLQELQSLIEKMYSFKDRARGVPGTFIWFVEEVGELARGLARAQSKDYLEGEFADVLAWLATLANVAGVDLEKCMDKFRNGCPGCRQMVCRCDVKNG